MAVEDAAVLSRCLSNLMNRPRPSAGTRQTAFRVSQKYNLFLSKTAGCAVQPKLIGSTVMIPVPCL